MHPIARDWYHSLEGSPQSVYFQSSDWAAARLLAHELTTYLGPTPRSGEQPEYRQRNANMFAALWSAMGDLLTTEGARRKLRIEVERPDPDESADADTVASLADYRERLSQSS